MYRDPNAPAHLMLWDPARRIDVPASLAMQSVPVRGNRRRRGWAWVVVACIGAAVCAVGAVRVGRAMTHEGRR